MWQADFAVAGGADRAARDGLAEAASLSEADRRLVNAIAAYHLLHGKAADALALLQLVLRLTPDDPQTIRLLAEAFLASGDPTTAATLIEAHERALGRARLKAADWLRRARALLRLDRLADARAAFAQYLARRGGPAC